jgi:hypothetical protein
MPPANPPPADDATPTPEELRAIEFHFWKKDAGTQANAIHPRRICMVLDGMCLRMMEVNTIEEGKSLHASVYRYAHIGSGPSCKHEDWEREFLAVEDEMIRGGTIPDIRGFPMSDAQEQPTPGAGGAGDELPPSDYRSLYESAVNAVSNLIAERDALRAAVEQIPDIIRKSGEPGPGGIDITSGIPSVVYVGIGREHYADDYELARETAEHTRDEAAGAVEVLLRAALARGPAADGHG